MKTDFKSLEAASRYARKIAEEELRAELESKIRKELEKRKREKATHGKKVTSS